MNESFMSAEVQFPVKLVSNKKVFKMLVEKKLEPVHIQLYPTNKCNLKCDFCSCSGRDKTIELSFERIMRFFLAHLNSIQSVTISGGGEPLMYSWFNELLKFFESIHIKIGLVTNGLLMSKYDFEIIKRMTWCRISLSEKSKDNDLFEVIKPYIENVNIDWAFSFVCSKYIQGDCNVIHKFYDAFKDRITHFRIVDDILNPTGNIPELKKIFGERDKIIYQERAKSAHGATECRLAMIKPVITASGEIQPCCGAQYAITGQEHDCHKRLKMGNVEESLNILNKNSFNTKDICQICYYDNYNKFIDMFFNDKIKHEEFI